MLGYRNTILTRTRKGHTMQDEKQNQETTKPQSPNSKYRELPDYVQDLLKNPGFENLFLAKNPRYLTRGYIDFLPDFGTKAKDKEYWHGKMFWRFVGWDINKKYSGTDLQRIRKEHGIGNQGKKANYVKNQENTLSR